MDFRQNLQQVAANRTEPVAQPQDNSNKKLGKVSFRGTPGWLKVLTAVALIGATLLVLAAAFALVYGDKNNESSFIDSSKYQAVFLNNGQVYFGKISSMNSQYVNIEKVFYLTQGSTTTSTSQASNDYTLVKLGCQQIHYPTDRMVISRDQVTFWENLDKNGKVVKSIEEFKKQNPNGEECKQAATQTQSPATNVPSQSTTPTTQTTQTDTTTTNR